MSLLMRRYHEKPSPDEAVAVPEFPDGAPDESWKVAELQAYAQAHDVDLGGATKKADMVAAIAAAAKPGPFDPSKHTPDEVLEYLQGLDDEDAEVHDAEVARVIQAERDGQNRTEILEAVEGTPES